MSGMSNLLLDGLPGSIYPSGGWEANRARSVALKAVAQAPTMARMDSFNDPMVASTAVGS